MEVIINCYLLQIPEQFRFMSQHPVKKKHKHKKHKSQESERSKEGGEAVSQASNLLEQDKPTPSSTGMCYLSIFDFLTYTCVEKDSSEMVWWVNSMRAQSKYFEFELWARLLHVSI